MDNFKEKIELLCKTQSEIDDYIWEIFYKYIEQEKINFSSPKTWNIEEGENDIQFDGSDGCMGCYDPMDIFIPLSFFINPKDEFSRLKKERLAEEKRKAKKEKAAVNRKDKQEFKRLKKKFA